MRTHASTTAKNDQRIVGGEQSKPGDFPYFVEMGGCGGALIAMDIVLFAAHCGNWKNQQVNVGSYTKYTTAQNSQPRFCEKWVADPLYNSQNLDYDFALCKLDSPVDVDQFFVKLVLNSDDNFPSDQTDLIVMGHGATLEGGSSANDLRNVTVPSLSNTQCKQYYGSGITDNMICAGYPDAGDRDSCQGDSGGPIIQRQYMNDGSFLDYHVGVVSWGEGCARPGYPGVYARTSKRVDWIESTTCGLGSVASFCSNPPPSCTTGQELTVEVTTDEYSIQDNVWKLTQNNNLVMERRFLVTDYTSTQKVCLEPETCYNWEITDTYGDGITGNGNYKLTLNGQVVGSGAGNTIGSGKTVEVCTGNGNPTPPVHQPTPAPVHQPTPVVTPPPTPLGSQATSETTSETDEANTEEPTKAPTPTASPTAFPSASPTASPTQSPTASPTPGASEETTSSTTDSCEDDPKFRYKKKKKKNCKWLSKQNTKKLKRFCKKKHKQGKKKGKVFDFCAKTCGECAKKKGEMASISI